MNIYVLVASILILGFVLGRILRRLRLTEVLAYILAGIIIGPVLNFSAPQQFNVIITGITLAFVAYTVGSTFSFVFLKRIGKQVVVILVMQVLITSVAVSGFVYLLTRNLPLSIILGSLAPAASPAGTIAVLRDLRARGTLTDVTIAMVGLADAVVVILFSVGIMWAAMLLGGEGSLSSSLTSPLWEIFGGLGLGGATGIAISYLAKKVYLSSEHIFVAFVATIILCWGLAEMIGVSAILACMALGIAVINCNVHIGNQSNELIDNVMTPVFVLFFAAIGMAMDFSLFHLVWPVVIVYCAGRTIGMMAGCRTGAALSSSGPNIKRYLGLALLNQAGVVMGLAFLAAQTLAGHDLGGTIITIMATTTAVYGVFAPLALQYAVKKAGEAGT
ncbi:MAG: cation:proton antiporter [Dehalococcoidia bacterium]|jgi:Kef-type K+ transport system membrane component KefB